MPKKDMEKVVSKSEQNSTNKCIALYKDEWVEELKKNAVRSVDRWN